MFYFWQRSTGTNGVLGPRGVTVAASVWADIHTENRRERGQGHVSMVNRTVKVIYRAMAAR